MWFVHLLNCNCYALRGIKDWVQGFCGCIMAKTSKEALGICLVLLHVAPPLLFTVTSFPDTPTNNLAAPSPSLKVYHCNKRDMQNLHEQNFFLHQDVLFPLAQLFIRGNSQYHFLKCWNWQICHTHRAFKLLLCTFRG